MLNSQQTYVGTHYTTTVALLVIACVITPALLLLSRPFGYGAPSLAVACSALCVALAWINWKRYSELTILSIASPRPRLK